MIIIGRVVKERPAFTRRMLRSCLRNGYAVLSIDRELVEFFKQFVSSGIGEFLELRGFIVSRRGRLCLRFGLGINALIELDGLNPRLLPALLGEPVIIQGFKVGPRTLRVERVRISSIARSRPYADYRYLKSVVLDGVELETPDDVAVLCLVSSPRQTVLRLAGGARQAVLGRCRSYLDARLRRSTLSSPCVWKFGGVDLKRVSLVERSLERYAEVSADIDSESPDAVAHLRIVDFPTIVSRAPRGYKSDFDAIDYTLWIKGLRPRIDPIEAMKELERISRSLCRRIASLGVDARMGLFSLDYEARPSTVLRLAHAIARIRGSEDPRPFISEALLLVERSLDAFVATISGKPTKIVKVRDLEKAILKALEKLEEASAEEVARELSVQNVRVIENTLERLRRKGLVYCPRPGLYRVTPL